MNISMQSHDDMSGLGARERTSGVRRSIQFAQRSLRRDPILALAFLVVILLVALALVPSLFAQFPPAKIDPINRLTPPGTKYWFGTDELGRDIFSRIVYATRTTLGGAVAIVLFATLVGIPLGAVAGALGGIVDEVTMRIVDLFLAFPLLVAAMAIVAVLGPGLQNAMIALVVIWWAQYARLTRGLVLQIRDSDYVLAATSTGVSLPRILARHILPNCVSPLLVKCTLDVAVAVLTTASLSFLGLGIQPPAPDWGAMISNGRFYILDAWWYPTFPGLAIFVTVMALNIIGDSLRDRLDPRLRS